MEEIISLYISNMTKSINLVINCKKLITILDLKELVAKKLDTYACMFRLTNGTNLEEDLDTLLSDLNIKNEDKLYFMNKLNIERAVLEEWFRLGGHNWNLHTNWCSDLPLNEWRGVTTNENGKITVLYLSGNNISFVPSELSKLTNLTRLLLSCNNISLVPSELSQLKNLTYLTLDYNNISLVSPELSQLKYLDLSHNKLISVPYELSQLKYLDLRNNNISSVPSELSQLTNLKMIYHQCLQSCRN